MTTATATAVRTLQIDPAHSEAAFQVRHLISKVRGRFTDIAGSIEFDEAEPERLVAADYTPDDVVEKFVTLAAKNVAEWLDRSRSRTGLPPVLGFPYNLNILLGA